MLRNGLTNIILILVLGFAIYYMTRPQNIKNEGFVTESSDEDNSLEETSEEQKLVALSEANQNKKSIISEVEEELNSGDVNSFKPQETKGGALIKDAFSNKTPEGSDGVDFNNTPIKKYDSQEYLPQEVNKEWFETDFSKAKYDVKDEQLINITKYVVGVDTVGQSLKNASYDIRGTVANPKFSVSPWNNSTYEPDFNIKPLC